MNVLGFTIDPTHIQWAIATAVTVAVFAASIHSNRKTQR